MSRSAAEERRAPPRDRRLAAALLLAALLLAPAAAPAAGPPASNFELSRSVSQSLLHLQEVWLQWISAFYQRDRAAAAAQVAELRTSLTRLGFTRLPELSMGATVRAIGAARQGDFERAEWALDDAEALDPGRPETAFGRAIAAWEAKRYPRAVWQQLVGYARLFGLTPNDELATHNLLLGALAVALLAGAGFVLVQLATKGSRLYWAISEPPRRAAGAARPPLTIVLLLLAAGHARRPAVGAALLVGAAVGVRLALRAAGHRRRSGCCSASTPLALARQQQKVAALLTPPVRAVAALNEGRLYGALFTDLGAAALRCCPRASPCGRCSATSTACSASGTRRASTTRRCSRRNRRTSTRLINLGAYHFLTGDHGGAVQFFQRAATADPNSAAAYYNLSQAYSDAYQFGEQREALARARPLDEGRVNRWIQQSSNERVITFNGGLARHEEVLRDLQRTMQPPATSAKTARNLRRWLPLGLALTALLLALALQRVLPRGDSPPPPRLVNRPGPLAMLLRVAAAGHPLGRGRQRRPRLPGALGDGAGAGAARRQPAHLPAAARAAAGRGGADGGGGEPAGGVLRQPGLGRISASHGQPAPFASCHSASRSSSGTSPSFLPLRGDAGARRGRSGGGTWRWCAPARARGRCRRGGRGWRRRTAGRRARPRAPRVPLRRLAAGSSRSTSASSSCTLASTAGASGQSKPTPAAFCDSR